VTSKALPAPAEVSAEPATATIQKAKAAPEPNVEIAGQPSPEINSMPKTEVKAESLHGFSKSLSPYPYVILSFTAYELHNVFLLYSYVLGI
jgi:chitinase domain-containing protein 1